MLIAGRLVLVLLGLCVLLVGCTRPTEEEGYVADREAVETMLDSEKFEQETLAKYSGADKATPEMLAQAYEAGEIMRLIEESPEEETRILQEHGLTAEQFSQRLREIAELPVLSDAFEEGRAGG